MRNRVIKVTDKRTKEDFAYFIEEHVEYHFSDAKCIQLVLDNLNTHFEGSLIEIFGKERASELLKKIKFIHTPVHGSWLTIVEIEINVMDRQCTGGRIKSKELLETNGNIWAKLRNEKGCRIGWGFTKKVADKKLGKYYVS